MLGSDLLKKMYQCLPPAGEGERHRTVKYINATKWRHGRLRQASTDQEILCTHECVCVHMHVCMVVMVV